MTEADRRSMLREERAELERKILLRQAAETLAHEIRNPLATLRGQLQMLGRRLADSDHRRRVQEALEVLDGVVHSSEELFGMEPDAPVCMETIDMVALIQDLAESYRRRLERREVDLKLHLPEHPMAILGDRQMLILGLECLLEGFLLRTEPGGGHRLEWGCRACGDPAPQMGWFEIVGPRFLPLPEGDHWHTYDPLLFERGFREAWSFAVAHHLLVRQGASLRLRRLPEGRMGLRSYHLCPAGNEAPGQEGGPA